MIVIPREVVEEGIQTMIKYVPSEVREDAKKETAKRMILRFNMIENKEKMVR